MIVIPIYSVDLMHHGLPIGERTSKSSMKPPQCEERKRKEERERWVDALFCREAVPT
jgi:hypothetical protein